MGKNIIICFDGTGNEPKDAEQCNSEGECKDDSISNIAKLHLLLGGDFVGGNLNASQQVSLYYNGVGTYGGPLRRFLNQALAFAWADVGRIIRKACKDINAIYEEGDTVFVFGFSRGAAIARRFATVIKEKAPQVTEISFLGVFDTVASFSFPNLDINDKPKSDVVFEHGGRVSSTVTEALHLLALDEKRVTFMPTLMERKGPKGRITEVWFAGAHSDIGGGYRKDGLSDVTLSFMIETLRSRFPDLILLSDIEIDYEQIDSERGEIDHDDVIVQPDPLGFNHQQMKRVTSGPVLGDREVRVSVSRHATGDDDGIPLVHHTAVQRIHDDADYNPLSLRNVKHRVWTADNTIENANAAGDPFPGLMFHRTMGAMATYRLQKGQSRSFTVYANAKYNRSFIILEEDGEYTFTVKAGQIWYDASIACGPEGWDRDDVTLGLSEMFIAWKERDRRLPDAQWFEVVGSLGTTDKRLVRMLKHTTRRTAWTPPVTRELFAFANDLDKMYFNNSGHIQVTVKRVA
ncbi:MAG: DUF2235 domain-containing protein [Magnetococcales bacterium]|nr:DUF2235 domain-containing protein [Magnetococcales bacterium]